jgi:cytochrome c
LGKRAHLFRAMPFATRILRTTLVAVCPLAAFSADGNAAKGRRLFVNQCAACHTTTSAHLVTGPALLGVVGRKAATLEGFAFSEPMKKSGLTWDAATLDKYLAAPTELVPGTLMTFSVPAPAARADVIAFLTTLTPSPSAPPAK